VEFSVLGIYDGFWISADLSSWAERRAMREQLEAVPSVCCSATSEKVHPGVTVAADAKLTQGLE